MQTQLDIQQTNRYNFVTLHPKSPPFYTLHSSEYSNVLDSDLAIKRILMP